MSAELNELIEREATARAIEGLKWASGQTIDDAIAFIASAVRNDRVFPAADRLEALAQPVAGVEAFWQRRYEEMSRAVGDLKGAIRPQLDAMEFCDHGEVRQAFNQVAIVAGETLNLRSALAASPSPVVGDREAIGREMPGIDVVDRARQIAQEAYEGIRPAGGKFWPELDDTTQTLAICAARDAILGLSTPVVGGAHAE